MGKFDDVLYDYFDNDERFADFYNGAMFQGRTVVQAEVLEDAAERYVSHAEDSSTNRKLVHNSKYRDVKKRARNGTHLSIMAIENQSSVDFTMPWRIMQYDQLEYAKQLRKIRERKIRECLKRGEKVNRFNVKFGKYDKLYPVYTICFYHGLESWDGPLSLRDMMDFGDEEFELKELFHDYKMTLVCLEDLKDLSVFHTDLKLLLQALQLRKNREAMDQLFEQEEFQNVAEDTARTIAIMTDYNEILNYINQNEEGGVNMCQAVEEIRQKYIDKGIKEGVKEGVNALIITCQELGATYEYVVEKLRTTYYLSDTEIQDYMDLYWIQS